MIISNYSNKYKKAVATLATALYEQRHLLKEINVSIGDPLLWDKVNELTGGQLSLILKKVEEKLNYELSFYQCCLAISLILQNYKPDNWKHLL